MPAPPDSALIDAVDSHDEVIGSVPRSAATTSGAGFRTVHVFVRNGRGLLLQRLAPSRERHAGRWGSSVAGYLHSGETYLEAAERRQREELGLNGPLREVGKTRFRESDATKFVTLFETEATGATVREPEHISELRWWTDWELASMVASAPERFTPTFQQLYAEFGAERGIGSST